MKKRRIIVICCIVAVLIILIGTMSALFNLKHVSVEILKNPSVLEAYGANFAEDVEKSADFNYGSNMLFTTYKHNQENIEKEFPFVKVEKMVRRFPNKMTIYVSGRIPEVIVTDSESANKWYVLDIEMKVVDVLSSESEIGTDLYRNLPIVTGAGMENLQEGDFVLGGENTKCLIGVLDGIYGKDQAPSSVMSDITIDLSGKNIQITLRDRSNERGAKILISGFGDIKEKVYAAYYLYDTTFDTDDLNYLIKSELEFRVGADFVPGTNERVVVYYEGSPYTEE